MTERTPLLLAPVASSSSSSSLSAAVAAGDAQDEPSIWSPSGLRRKSAFISDFLSSHTHSTDTIVEDSIDSKRQKGYDGEFKDELERDGEGIRQWYDNYTSIDWLHDSIKNQRRLQRLRSSKRNGWSGFLANSVDGSQGWILVSVIGALTALVAYAIISSEMLLFDLKSGYCEYNWRLAKRFCRSSSWRTWGQLYHDLPPSVAPTSALVDNISFILIAVSLAVLSSTLTIYLSSSASVYSSKDAIPSTSASHPAPRSAKVFYMAAGSGIPELKTILSGFVIRGYLGTWTLATKSVGLALSVASGLSLGKEGPLVHVASCVGNIASRFSAKYDRNEGKRREIISAACAAGVAVSFGAPVGGTLFSLEEVSFFFPPKVMWRSFFCALVAAATLKALDPFRSGKIVLFEVTYDRDWHSLELIGFAILGALGGVYGAVFCKANIWWTRNIRNRYFRTHPILEVALVSLLTASLPFFNPFSKLGGTELVFELFSECKSKEGRDGGSSLLCVQSSALVWELVVLLAAAFWSRLLMTIITFGLKLPAGIFIPTLACGAITGRIAALLVELWHAHSPHLSIFNNCIADAPFGQACVIPGVWSMISAAAFLAGVTRTTVSLAVIMFELTGSVAYTIPVMLAVLVSKTVADAVESRSIYDLVIELSDLPYLDVKTEYIFESQPLDILDPDAAVISLDEINTVGSLKEQLLSLHAHGSAGGFPIVAREISGGRRMYAYIASKELEHGLASSMAIDDSMIVTFRTAMNLLHSITTTTPSADPTTACDFSWLIDIAPLVLNVRSPMELVHQTFSKLGVRYVVFCDERGLFLGVLDKNRYLHYLRYLEKNKSSGYIPRLRHSSSFMTC